VTPSPESGDKLGRFGPFSSQCRAGNVSILRGPWNETLFHILEGFPDLAHDDEVDACSGALEMLNPQNERLGHLRTHPPTIRGAQRPTTTIWVRLQAPPGTTGAVQTFSNRHLNIGLDGTVVMSAEDAAFLIRAGWTKLTEWEGDENP
jgi:hypothetical protein